MAAQPLGLGKAVIGSVSAGAAMACLARSGRTHAGMSVFKRLFKHNPRNIYPGNLLRGKPIFPQYRMLTQGLREILDDSATAVLKRSAEIRVLLARPPRFLPAGIAAIVGMGVYTAEKKARRPVHPKWAARIGFRPQTVAVQSCEDAATLVALILQSSCTPPVVPVQYRKGKAVLDGGVIDNVPVMTVAGVPGPVLVLLTRRYGPDRFPTGGRCHYLQPSRTPPISRWDYTDPHGLQQTFDLGRKDADVFIRQLERGTHGLRYCNR